MTLIYKETIPPNIKNSTIVLESLYSVLFFSKASAKNIAHNKVSDELFDAHKACIFFPVPPKICLLLPLLFSLHLACELCSVAACLF